ncbi:MAG: ribonuclease P protein component [Candidatus Kerfeldbacteria bacterium]|nr:ribonuclease P protein component [Candidatus Kerfeldbacteria bacterium]
MLPRRSRLHTRKHHQVAWRHGRPIRGKYFVARVIRRTTGSEPRFGFVVPGTVSKLATTRNLIKRRARNICRKLPIGPVDVVLYATKASASATHEQLRHDLISILNPQPHAPRR